MEGGLEALEETRRAAWISRAAAAIALDELYARTTPEPATDTAVNGDASAQL